MGQSLALLGADRDSDEIAEAVDLSPVGSHPPDRSPTEHDLATEPGTWQEELVSAEVDVIEDVVGPRLAMLGYEPA